MRNKKLSLCLFLFLSFLQSQVLNAQTIEVSDSIKINTNWSVDTVKVIDDITVAEDVVLTIDPGTYIEFQGHYKLIVSGIIQAVGTANDQITFTINDTTGFYDLDTTAGGWNGVRFIETPFSALLDTEFRHCIFEYGKATDGDGGSEVQEDYGGAIYIYDSYEEVTFDSCIIRNCKAQWNGGAIYLGHAHNTLIQNCLFSNNSSYNGGAMYTSQTYGMKVYGSLIHNNTAEYGGAIRMGTSDCLFVNNIFANNESQYWGGALYASQGWDIRLFNNTIVNNKGRRGGGFYSFENLYPHHLVNNIFWGNIAESDSSIYKNTQTIRIEHCDIQDGSFGNKNLNRNPLFISPTAGAGSNYDGSQAN
ncbi:MAG: right-handed parallel beta-helix repeat-containing protein, partial [Planctomycetota bacterium]